MMRGEGERLSSSHRLLHVMPHLASIVSQACALHGLVHVMGHAAAAGARRGYRLLHVMGDVQQRGRFARGGCTEGYLRNCSSRG